jgi:TonB family protein
MHDRAHPREGRSPSRCRFGDRPPQRRESRKRPKCRRLVLFLRGVRHMRRWLLAMIMLQVCVAAGADTTFVAAHYLSGGVPEVPVQVVAGGEVFLELLVSRDGRVDSIRTLRTTPPFTDEVIAAVRGWRFIPAKADGPVSWRVFVAAMFTPPALNGPTLGEAPQDLALVSEESPMPIVPAAAEYPLRAVGSGTVLIEVTIDNTSTTTDARILVSSPAFDAAAIAAAKSWSFADAHRGDTAVTTQAYLLFGFQQPVVRR